MFIFCYRDTKTVCYIRKDLDNNDLLIPIAIGFRDGQNSVFKTKGSMGKNGGLLIILLLILILSFCSSCASLENIGKGFTVPNSQTNTKNLTSVKTDTQSIPSSKNGIQNQDSSETVFWIITFSVIAFLVIIKIRSIRKSEKFGTNNSTQYEEGSDKFESAFKSSTGLGGSDYATDNKTKAEEDNREQEEKRQRIIEYLKNSSTCVYVSLKPLSHDELDRKYMFTVYGEDRSKGCWELPLWSIDDLGYYLETYLIAWGFRFIEDAETAGVKLWLGQEVIMKRKEQQKEYQEKQEKEQSGNDEYQDESEENSENEDQERSSEETCSSQMNRKSECLQILGLEGEWPSRYDVKKRYHELALENHPDTLKQQYPHLSDAEFEDLVAQRTELMGQINQAYSDYLKLLEEHEAEMAA